METSSGSIGLTPEQFDVVFPFHLMMDRHSVVVQTGPSLRRLCPGARPGIRFADLFALRGQETLPNFLRLLEMADTVTFWQCRETGLILRGQILPTPERRSLLLLWIPWLSDAAMPGTQASVPHRGDYALHDPTLELLEAHRTQQSAFRTFRNLVDKLSERNARLEEEQRRLSRQLAACGEERKKLLRQCEENRKLALIASRIDSAVVLTDADGKVEWVNEGFVRLSGYTLADIAGKKPGALLQGRKTDAAIVEYIRRQLRKREGFTAELLNYAKSGREYWVHVEAQPILDEQGNVVNFVAMEREITERLMYEQTLLEAKREAEASNRAKTEFLAVVSHEIRTPMSTIQGTLDLLRDSALAEEQRLWVANAGQASASLAKIIDDVLDFSMIETGSLALSPVVFDLKTLLEETQRLFLPRAEAKGLALAVDVAPATPSVLRGDSLRLRQVLASLLGSAFDHTGQGRIEIGVAPIESGASSTCLFFHVRDTGRPVSRELREHLFRSLSCADSAASPGDGGVRLNLAICRHLVRLMGGDIGVESVPAGGNDYWFTVRLDLVAGMPDMAAALSGGAGFGKAPPTPGKILVAEDGEANRLVIQTILRRAGHEVSAVNDGGAAVDAALHGDFDLILMGLRMPVMDGYQATRAIRALEGRVARIPIVALTANALLEHRDACLAAGMDDFIGKPVARDRLLGIVSRWLRETKSAAVPPRPVPEPPLLDPELLRSLADITDETTMRRTVGMFFGASFDYIARIEAGLESENMEMLQQVAHDLKGNALLIGAVRLAEVARELAAACKGSQKKTALERAGETVGLFGRTRAAYGEHGILI